jgi:predicted porin
MKKSLFALAAVTAFAGAAQAQSSVTVYGILDVGYVGGNAKATAAGVKNSETVSQLGQSAETTSRLGFRGTEDLGGGTSAFFTFETGLSPNSSTLSTFNNRQAFVGLAQKGMGRAAIGTVYTPVHVAVGKTSAGQHNNIVGDVIYPQSSGLNSANASNANQNNIAYTIRTNNTLQLQSENVAGFVASAFYALNNKDEAQNRTTTNVGSFNATTGSPTITATTATTGGTTNINGYGLGLDYTWKKLLVSANYQSFKNETDSTATASVAGVNATDNQMYFGATYDFGILKAYAQYINKKVTSNLNSNQYFKRSAQQIGVRGNWTPKIESWASVGNGSNQSFGLNSPTANITGYQLGTNYYLSKRTNLYGIFGASQTSSTSNTAGAVTNYNANNYAVGVRHTF